MRNMRAVWLAVFLLAVSGRLDAQSVISFSELNPTQNPILVGLTCADPTGFRFLSDHFHVVGTYPLAFSGYTSNDSTHLGYESGRGFPIRMERVGSGTFTLFSLDAAEFYAAPVADRPDAQMLQVTGYFPDGSSVSHTVNLDGLRDGPGGIVDFEHVELPATFTNLRAVVFTGLRDGNLSGGASIDNLTYQLATPEPLAPCVPVEAPTTAPTVVLTSPGAGNVAGTVQIAASATDSAGVAGVTFKVDGVAVGPEDVVPPYEFAWNTSTVADGTHLVSAEARNVANAIATASVVVNVWNNPVTTGNPHYVDLDGLDDYLSTPDADGLTFAVGGSDSPMTIEGWIRPDRNMTDRQQLVAKWADGVNQEYKLHIASGLIRFDLRDPSANASSYAFTSASQAGLVGGWHHVAVTYDGRGGATAANGIAIYVDGVSVPLTRSNSAAYVSMENSAAPLQIGREATNWKQFNGAIDDVRLWNIARSPSAIQAAMVAELVGTEPGLVAYWRFNEGLGGTVADDSPNPYTLTLFGGTTWAAGGPLSPTVIDTTPPVLSNITTSSLTDTSVTIAFSTDENTTGWVSYTAGTACPCTNQYATGSGTAHVVTLTGLAPDTLYQFTANATDLAGNAASSAAMTFRTLLPPPDGQPPAVTLTTPTAGVVSGLVSVAATAVDNVGVVGVRFRLDGAPLGAEDTVAPYTMSWDTTSVADGPHSLVAEARDAAGNVGVATVGVTVANAGSSGNPYYLDLNGLDEYLTTPDVDALSFTNGSVDAPLTLEAWIRPDGNMTDRQQLISKWIDGFGQEYKLHISSGVIRFDLRDPSAGAVAFAYTSNQAGLVGAWHHVAVTYDGRGGATAANGISIYVDGVPMTLSRGNSPAYVAMENTTVPLQIGREYTAWKHFNGAIDDVRVWNVARTESQIQGFRSAELSGTEPGLVAYWRFNEGVGSTVADDSPFAHTLTAVNEPAWVAGGPLGTSGPDVTPPAITNVATSNVTASTLTVSFTTSEAATAWVSHTAGTACPCIDVLSAATGTAHTVLLTGLLPDTLYQFTVTARDAAGNAQTSTPMTVRTLVPPPDAQPPVVTLTSPASGVVAGVVTVAATAVDNVGVVGVLFRLDGALLGSEDATAPYSLSWDTASFADGPHTLSAEARDAMGNIGSVTVSITVQNAPVVTTPFYMKLDGVNDYLSAPDADGLTFGNGTSDSPLTIEAWIRPDANMTDRQHLVAKWIDGVGQEYKLHVAAGSLRLDLRDPSSGASAYAYTGSQTALVGAWHHVAATYDGRGGATAAQGITIYVDGVAVPLTRVTSPSYVAMENTTVPFQVGREFTNWKHFNGGVDEIRLWSVARTATQIEGFRSVELTGTEPGLVGYWRFNEGSGSSVADDSPAVNALTPLNGPVWFSGGPLNP